MTQPLSRAPDRRAHHLGSMGALGACEIGNKHHAATQALKQAQPVPTNVWQLTANQDRKGRYGEMEQTMKKGRALFAMAIALLVAFAMSIPVTALMGTQKAYAAATNATINITADATGHTYEVYQLLVGDVVKSGNEQSLTNIQWGTGITEAGKNALGADSATNWAHSIQGLTEAQAEAYFGGATVTTSAGVTLPVWDDAYLQNVTEVKGTSNPTSIAPGSEGYYLIRDKAGSLDGAENKAYTSYVVRVLGSENVSVNTKASVPTVVKKVKEESYTGSYTENNVTKENGLGYNDVADYDLGDHVPFMLIGTMPSKYDSYKPINGGNGYKYIFNDKLSEGLTYDTGSIAVTILHDDGTEEEPLPVKGDGVDGYEVSYDSTTGALTVSFDDLTKFPSIDADSRIVVRYTATLNQNAVIGTNGNPNTVYLQYSNNPNSGGESSLGKTPEDKVIVYTFALDLTKRNSQTNADGSHTLLAGAEFTIEKMTHKGSGSSASWEGTGQYAIVDLTTGKVTGWTDTLASATRVVTNDQGKLVVTGLDAGHYQLTETKAPTGYTELTQGINFAITTNSMNTQEWAGTGNPLTDLTIAVDNVAATANNNGVGDVSTGTVGMTVSNTSQSQLPTTGGIGTTIFYVVGAALVIGAGIVLVVRRRMRKN